MRHRRAVLLGDDVPAELSRLRAENWRLEERVRDMEREVSCPEYGSFVAGVVGLEAARLGVEGVNRGELLKNTSDWFAAMGETLCELVWAHTIENHARAQKCLVRLAAQASRRYRQAREERDAAGT